MGAPRSTALARLLPRVRPHRAKLGLAAICLLLSGSIALAFPQIVRHLLDAAFISRNADTLNRIALSLLGLFAVQAALTYVQVYLLTSTAERIIAAIRRDLFASLINLSPGFFTEARTGELTSRLSADTAVLQTVLSTNLSEFTRQSLLLVGGIILLTLTHPALTATTLTVVPLAVLAAVVFGRMLRKASTGVQDRVAEASGTADEAFSQIRTVQSFTRERTEIVRYSEHLSDVVRAALHRAKIRAGFFSVLTFFGFGSIVVVLWQGGRLVLLGKLSAGALVAFLLYAIYVAGAVGSLASLFGAYQEAVGAAKRVFDLLEARPEVEDPENPVQLPEPVNGAVELRNIGFRYAASLPEVLTDVSLAIAPGEVVALVGPSGAGKTTIAALIPRFWDVTRGEIRFDGVDIRNLKLRDLRRAIGIVPQEPALFSGTVRENIAFEGRDGKESGFTDEEIIAAARAAHAWEFIERLSGGLDTRVGERGIKLSGGQRQRIAIARVFIKNPSFVILDEATSSLDSESEGLIEAAMEDLLRARSTLIIAHRLSTVLRADRIVVLDRGKIVEAGTHSSLLAAEGLYARLYRGQFRGDS